MDDFSGLFSDDAPTAQQRALAIANALRGRQGLATLVAGGQNDLITGVGKQELANVGQQQQMLAQGVQQGAHQRLTRALQASQQGFTGGENSKNRSAEMERLQLELGTRRDLAKEKALLDAKKQAQDAGEGLRKELMGNPVTKAAQEVAAAYSKIQGAAKVPSAAGDLSLIFSFMKILDPGSSVREGEFANAQNAGGIPERMMAQYNNMLRGERLAPEVRADFLTQSKNLYDAQMGRYNSLANQYRGQAQRSGAAPEDVVFDLFGQGAAPAATPSAAAAPNQDAAALDWAKANANDPRAAQILQSLGVK